MKLLQLQAMERMQPKHNKEESRGKNLAFSRNIWSKSSNSHKQSTSLKGEKAQKLTRLKDKKALILVSFAEDPSLQNPTTWAHGV